MIYGITKNLNLNLITYGFNSKSTVTTSSTENDEMLLCIQRNVQNIQGKIIEPGEIKINFDNKKIDNYLKIGVSILEILYSK